MRITNIDPFILHVPVTGAAIADSTNQVTHWGAPGVIVETDSNVRGYGYTGTLGHLPTDRLIRDCIAVTWGPLIIGEDPWEVRAIWGKLSRHPAVHWVGRAGITQMALSAIDIALWDIKAKQAEAPLWKLILQPDATRLGGITSWWQVADLGYAHRLSVVAHADDMVQVHLQLSIAHSACKLLEYIPRIRECFAEPAAVEDGYFKIPNEPGAGTTLVPDALDRFGVE